ncbi:MAG: alpha/beta fold hydrolase, partial [Planctomycetota bacterium]
DRADPDGPSVGLHVAVFESKNPDPTPDPVIYLEGGPGGDALESVVFSFTSRFAPFLERGDFIMFDQRGTGYAEPSLDCPEYRDAANDILRQAIAPEAGEASQVQALERCHSRLELEGVDFASYNSRASAADIEDLRIALGYESWNLYGISYGTRLAQTVMRDFPGGIRSVILDSSYPPDVDLLGDTPANIDRAFGVFFNSCQVDADCASTYPDLEQRFFALVTEADADPIELTVTHPLTRRLFRARIDGTTLVELLFRSLYSAELIPILPEAVAELEAANYDTLEQLVALFLVNAEFVSTGMSISVLCNEEVVFTTPSAVDGAAAPYPELQSMLARSLGLNSTMFDICGFWNAGTAPSIANDPVGSSIPTLVMAGEFDPITPPSWGRQAMSGLTSSFFFEFPGVGHGASVAGDCPRSMALAFLDDPGVSPDGTCITTMEPPPYVQSDSAVEYVLVPLDLQSFGMRIVSVVPEGWSELLAGTYARSSNGLDETAIIFQALPMAVGDGTADLFASQLGVRGGLELTDTYETPAGTWNRYAFDVDGTSVDLAVLERGSATGVVLMTSEPDERDELFEAIFEPALDAFEMSRS